MYFINIVIIAAILSVCILSIAYVFRNGDSSAETYRELDEQKLSVLIKEIIDENMTVDVTSLNLNETETKKREAQKQELKNAVRNCMTGGRGEKEYLKDYIKEIMQRKLGINETNIDVTIPFENPELLSSRDKFDILMMLYSKENYKSAFMRLARKYGWMNQRPDRETIVVTKEDLDFAYQAEDPHLSYSDKLTVLTNREYSYFGHGVIDELRDNAIDGIGGGHSGLTETAYDYVCELESTEDKKELRYVYDSIWVLLSGVWIHLDFLSFGSMSELERVTRALAKNDAPYELTRNNPKIITDMRDGSRVLATCPPISENWVFFLRKFESAPLGLTALYTGKNREMLTDYLVHLVRGSLYIAVTGAQGSGKTTLLKELIRYINPQYNIRTSEQVFEINVRNILPDRNIVPFRETSTVAMEELMEILRKTDANCILLGEVASEELAEKSTQLSKITAQQILTSHQVSTDALVSYFKQALMNRGAFASEALAEEEVVRSININVHLEKNPETGDRFVQFIDEIVPVLDDNDYVDDTDKNLRTFFERTTKRHVYKVRRLLHFDDENGYVFDLAPSTELIRTMKSKMRKNDYADFMQFLSSVSDGTEGLNG